MSSGGFFSHWFTIEKLLYWIYRFFKLRVDFLKLTAHFKCICIDFSPRIFKDPEFFSLRTLSKMDPSLKCNMFLSFSSRTFWPTAEIRLLPFTQAQPTIKVPLVKEASLRMGARIPWRHICGPTSTLKQIGKKQWIKIKSEIMASKQK